MSHAVENEALTERGSCEGVKPYRTPGRTVRRRLASRVRLALSG